MNCYRPLLILLVILVFNNNALGQKCEDVDPDTSFIIRSVHIKGRWIPPDLKSRVDEIVGVGKSFNKSQIFQATVLVSHELAKYEGQFPPQLAGAMSVSHTDYKLCLVEGKPKEVDVIIRPYYLRVDLFNIGNNLVPVPRSNKPTFYDQVPKALIVINPVVGFNHDREYGTSFSLQTLTDLLHVSELSDGSNKLKLNLGLEGRKSINEDFYTIGSSLNLSRPSITRSVLGWNIGLSYLKKLQPMAGGQYDLGSVRLQGGAEGSTKLGLLKKYYVGGSFRSLKNDFDTQPGKNEQNNESGYNLLLHSDGTLGKSLSRLSLCFDQGFPDESDSHYQRIAARLGYGVSLRTKRDPHQAFDVDVVAGTGHAWGAVPVYSQFYAGNTVSNFLYQPLHSMTDEMLVGPTIRSLGEREGWLSTVDNSIKGGTTFWNLSLNISIPIKGWSKPLIPNDTINDETGATLQSVLKRHARRSASIGVANDLIDNQGYPENAETDSIAAKIAERELMPMIEYVTDRANVFSLKPVLLFDIANMSQSGLGSRTWVGLGAGLQVNVIIARLQAGYMQTVSPNSESSKGNFLLKFVFENFY